MNKEIWKLVNNFETKYAISNFGRIKNIITNYIFMPQKRGNYLKVSLSKNGIKKQLSIHKLVAETFLNKQDFKSMPDEDRNFIDLNKLEVNHKDENKYNNNVNNLEWCTHKYNTYYSKCIEKCGKAKEKKIEQFDINNCFIKQWDSIKEASNKLKICQSLISKCVLGQRKQTHGYIFKYANERGD